jgi:hypothetical protein
MGTVFLARELSSGRIYALKVIRGDLADRTAFRARFEREAQILRSLEHPNIVRIHSAGEVDGVPYIVTEFARDGDLRSFLAGGELSISTVLSILWQSAAGLEAAHAKRIVHRDVKPGNLLVERGGDRLVIKVTDFGIAWGHDFATSYTPFGRAIGTPGYMSPECQRGEAADHTADVFSLGCCLKFMLGEAANQGPIVEVLRKAWSETPADRQQTVMDLYRDAAEALEGYGRNVISNVGTPGHLSETRLDTPASMTPVRGAEDRPAVIDRVLERLGLDGTIESARLARGRSDRMLVTGLLTTPDPGSLGPHLNRLAAALANQLQVERVQLVLLPSGDAIPDIVRTYLSVLFAAEVPAEDLASVAARRIDGLLEIDLPPRVDRLCGEDVLVPLVAQLGVRTVKVNRHERKGQL